MKEFIKYFIYYLSAFYCIITGLYCILWLLFDRTPMTFELGVTDFIFGVWAVTYAIIKSYEEAGLK